MLSLEEMGEVLGKAQYEHECVGKSLNIDYGILAVIYEVSSFEIECYIEPVTERYEIEADDLEL